MPYMYMLSTTNNKVLYVGSTTDLSRRAFEHQGNFAFKSFTARYRVYKLVYYEYCDLLVDARAREWQVKKWNRAWKERLIDKLNPGWDDLSHLEMFR